MIPSGSMGQRVRRPQMWFRPESSVSGGQSLEAVGLANYKAVVGVPVRDAQHDHRCDRKLPHIVRMIIGNPLDQR